MFIICFLNTEMVDSLPFFLLGEKLPFEAPVDLLCVPWGFGNQIIKLSVDMQIIVWLLGILLPGTSCSTFDGTWIVLEVCLFSDAYPFFSLDFSGGSRVKVSSLSMSSFSKNDGADRRGLRFLVGLDIVLEMLPEAFSWDCEILPTCLLLCFLINPAFLISSG